ncbi:MAG TPA: hypothetical protein VJT31_19865 [Rugosimonospora sp.]|nr:hypothetical protein [Rugosimonospora sp.]
MTSGVVHHARLAWDAARVVVAVADSDEDRLYEWLVDQLDLVGGPELAQALSISRTRLLYRMRPDARAVEAGMWRARLHDLLDYYPEQAGRLAGIVAELAAVLP